MAREVVGGSERRTTRFERKRMLSRRWKGKERERGTATPKASASASLSTRDEGSGGSDGIVVDLNLVGDGTWEAVYTVPVQLGSNNQSFDLQVDMGSADLWVASKSCSSASCKKVSLYDPASSSSAQQTGKDFNIQYLSGQVQGPIYWDSLTVGGYGITNQALAAATSVYNESLSSDYSGILGLALQSDSIIATDIPPVTSSNPDGQTVVSNLFGSSPSTTVPSQFFLSLLLNRPGSSRVPATLGIGRHPSNDQFSDGMTLDPSKVSYSYPISEADGVHFWKSELRGINVYINDTVKQVSIGRGVSGSVFPEAVLDSGVPYIISTPSIANAVWGALGISPASDGNYYLPCTMPLNMTILLDDRSEIPIHPLDMTAQPSGGSQCMGLFQQSGALDNPSGFGDIILGVSFLRNVYTVMAYESVSSGGIVGNDARRRSESNPQLGLLSITNSTLAMDEFNQVRLQNKPLDGNTGSTSTSSAGLSTESKVGIALGGFFFLCAVLLGARFFYTSHRNKKRKQKETAQLDASTKKEAYALAAFHLQPFRTQSFHPSIDTQATLNDPFARLDKKYDTTRGKLTSLYEEGDELGFIHKSKASGDSASVGSNDHVDEPRGEHGGRDGHTSWIDAYSENSPQLMGEWRPPTMHERNYSSSSNMSGRGMLLDRDRPASRSRLSDPSPDEFGGLPILRTPDVSEDPLREEPVRTVGDRDRTLLNDNRRGHERKLSSSSASSNEWDETTPIMAVPPAGVTQAPRRGPLPRPERSATGPRPASTASRSSS